MKLTVIKYLAENKSISELREVESQLCNDNPSTFEVTGEDKGEQLTHILAAIEVLETVEKENVDLRSALRSFSERVRNSIS